MGNCEGKSLDWDHLQIMGSGEHSVLFDSSSGKISVLNRVGLQILDHLRSGLSAPEIEARLAEIYGIPLEHAQRDLLDFLGQLRRNKMVRVK